MGEEAYKKTRTARQAGGLDFARAGAHVFSLDCGRYRDGFPRGGSVVDKATEELDHWLASRERDAVNLSGLEVFAAALKGERRTEAGADADCDPQTHSVL
jgi:hypothetical protein